MTCIQDNITMCQGRIKIVRLGVLHTRHMPCIQYSVEETKIVLGSAISPLATRSGLPNAAPARPCQFRCRNDRDTVRPATMVQRQTLASLPVAPCGSVPALGSAASAQDRGTRPALRVESARRPSCQVRDNCQAQRVLRGRQVFADRRGVLVANYQQHRHAQRAELIDHRLCINHVV